LAFQSFNSSVLCILPSRNHWFILKKLNSWWDNLHDYILCITTC
jgi:hypothetical protein